MVILGAGTLGEYAARTALGLGATVKVFDHSVNRLRQLTTKLGQRIYTSVFHKPVLERALSTTDVLVGAMRCFGNEEDIVVSEEQVKLMKRGSVIVDLSIDQGGCIGLSLIHICQRNGASYLCVPDIRYW